MLVEVEVEVEFNHMLANAQKNGILTRVTLIKKLRDGLMEMPDPEGDGQKEMPQKVMPQKEMPQKEIPVSEGDGPERDALGGNGQEISGRRWLAKAQA